MPSIDPLKVNEEACKCGRSAERVHCPHCGRAKLYGFAKTIKRPHPITGDMILDVHVYRCHSCGRQFDELQWKLECKAPTAIIIQHKKKMEETKAELMERARRGEDFDTNDKRHFRRIVGIHYEDFRQMNKNIDDMRIKAEFAKLGIKSEAQEPEVAGVIKKDGKTIFKIPGLGE